MTNIKISCTGNKGPGESDIYTGSLEPHHSTCSNGDLMLFCAIHIICAGIVTGQCDKYQNLVLAAKALASLHICMCSTEPCHSNEISCAGSNGDLRTVYVNSECCGECTSNHGISVQPSVRCINVLKCSSALI